MKNPSNYSITSELKKRVPMFIALLILAAMIALNVAVPEPVLEPDSVYPMANTNVTWAQTWHYGPWGDA